MPEVLPIPAQEASLFLGKQLVESAKHLKIATSLSAHELGEAVSEVEEQTQTKGASFIKVHFVDPAWDLITSGMFDRNTEGLLPELTVELPQHTGRRWVLCACEPSNELSQPNFVCTFEDEIVAKLKNKWGPKRAKPGFNTRAEFIRELCQEAGVKYCIPSVEGAEERRNKQVTARHQAKKKREAEAYNKKFNEEFTKKFQQEFDEVYEHGEALTMGPGADAAAVAKGLKEPGVQAGAPVTVGGKQLSEAQRQTVNTLLGVAKELKAPPVATEALIYAAIGETKLGGENNTSSAGAKGVLQSLHAPYDTASQAKNFLNGNEDFHKGGAIALSRVVSNPKQIAVEVEVPSFWPANSYETEAGGQHFLTEAKAIIQAYGGTAAVSGTSGNTPAASKQGEVTRGTSSNPDENSWDCIIRLAGQVNYSAFTDGNTFFYLDGPELVQQWLAAYIYPKPSENLVVRELPDGKPVKETGVIQVPLNATFDNTSVEYFEDHKVKARSQKRSRIGKPQSPSEIKMNLLCNPGEFPAGQVVEFVKAGPLNGRWIITDSTRNLFKDRYTQLLLEPPSAPIAESEEGVVASSPTQVSQAGGNGTSKAIAEQALKAWGEHDKYVYTEASPERENNRTLYGPSPRHMDCSSFYELCCKEAGVPDPSGQNYSPVGNTDSLIRGMAKVSSPEPGDAAFFGASESATQHVVVYVGNGEAVGMETYGVNMLKGAVADLGKGAGVLLGYWRVKS